jgi:hypothetical protein
MVILYLYNIILRHPGRQRIIRYQVKQTVILYLYNIILRHPGRESSTSHGESEAELLLEQIRDWLLEKSELSTPDFVISSSSPEGAVYQECIPNSELSLSKS